MDHQGETPECDLLVSGGWIAEARRGAGQMGDARKPAERARGGRGCPKESSASETWHGTYGSSTLKWSSATWL